MNALINFIALFDFIVEYNNIVYFVFCISYRVFCIVCNNICTFTSRKVNKCSAVAVMGDRVATIDMGRKLGVVHLWGREGGSPSNTMWPWLRPTSLRSGTLIHPAVSPQQACAENWRGLCPFGGGGAGSLSNTVWPRLRPTFLPSCILIHPAV